MDDCHDPACFPYCAACGSSLKQSLGAGVIMMLVVILCIMSMLLVFWLVYGPTLIRVTK